MEERLMVERIRETPAEHDAFGGLDVEARMQGGGAALMALPTPSTPGYTVFVDYLGRKWTCCVCMKEYLTYAQRCWIKLGWIKSGIDVWQLTGDASASVGTHSKGGVGDLLFQTSDKFVNWLRDHGATAAWRRTIAQGFTKVHVHFCLRGCPHLAPAAATQVTEEKAGPPTGASSLGYHGGDGLTGTKFDYHRDPAPYMDWNAGVALMKKELGLLAKATTTTISIWPNPSTRLEDVELRGITSPSTAVGTHRFEYSNDDGKTWMVFKPDHTISDTALFIGTHRFGGNHRVRVKFIPKDPLAFQPSQSDGAFKVTTIPVQDLASKTDLAALEARVAALEKPPPDPPEPVPAYGVDVAGHQSVEQVQAAAADSTIAFIIVKATQGKAYVTDSWKGNYRELAGAKYLGPYHYAEPPQDPVAEMQHFLATAQPASGHVLFLDEEFYITANNRDVLTAEQEADLARCILEAARYLRAETGARALVYTNWLWVPRIRRGCTVEQWEELVTTYPCWLAQYSGVAGKHDPIDPKPGSTLGWPVLLHQYTSTPMDHNWTPDLNELRKLAIP